MYHWFKLLILSVLLAFPAYGVPEEQVTKAIRSSAKIKVKGVGVASAISIAYIDGRSYLLTNDHVCQMTRGKNLFSGINSAAPINRYPILLLTANGRSYHALVEATTNATKDDDPDLDQDDLCLVSTPGHIPPATLAVDEPDLGNPIFSVSSPLGVFPMIHDGRIGKTTGKSSVATTLPIAHGSSGGGVFDKDTGLLIGLVTAIQSDEDIKGPTIAYIERLSRIQKFLNTNLQKAAKRYEH